MKRIIKNLIIFIILFSFFGFLFTTPINKIGVSNLYDTPPQPNHHFDSDELNEFVLLWAKAEKSSIKKHMDNSLLDPEGQTTWFFRRWLSVHNWNDDRFFYCQHRLITILRCIALEKNYQDNIKMSQSQNINLNEIINEQTKILSKCKSNSDEYELIKKNFNNIIAIIPQVIQQGIQQ